MLVPSPRVHPRQLSLRPWQVVDIAFPTEQREYLLQSIVVDHEPFPMTLLEARVRRRRSHHWLSERTRRHDWLLVEQLRSRNTDDARVMQVFYKSYVLLAGPMPWSFFAPAPTLAAAHAEEDDWRPRRSLQRQPAMHIELGETLTVRFRNGRRPTAWNFLLRGVEMIERNDTPMFAPLRIGQ